MVRNSKDRRDGFRLEVLLQESWMMTEPKSTLKLRIVGEQVAAARRLLRMTQRDLAAVTGLAQGTIVTFEAGRPVRPESIEAMREALLERGIVFTNGGAPGVKILRTDPED